MESRFNLFGDRVSLGAKIGAWFAHNAPWYSLVKRLMWNLGSVCLEIVLIMMQDRCMVCMKHTICLEINLDKPDVTVDAPDGNTRGSVSYGISLWFTWRKYLFRCKIVAWFVPSAP